MRGGEMFCYLPLELESEILSRVPATSLSQSRTTCQRWFDLCKDKRFIKKNLGKGKAATQVVLKNGRRVCSVSIDLQRINNDFDPSVEFTGSLKSLKGKDREEVKIHEIFHCDGLLLCTTYDYRLVLWNPCTGQTRWMKSDKRCRIHHKYFLGYEENKESWHNYKILRVTSCSNQVQKRPVFEFGIYEMESDSWKRLDGVAMGCNLLAHGVSLKGNTYWVGTYQNPYATHIVKFDFTTESFGCMSLPFHSKDGDDETLVLSVVAEEKLAVLRQRFDGRFGEVPLRMKIWVSNNMINEAKDLSWNFFLEVDFREFGITWMTSVLGFLVDEENEMVICCDTETSDEDRTRIYIVGENVHRVYKDTEMGSSLYLPQLVSYVPSLVQIPAGKSHPGGKRKR